MWEHSVEADVLPGERVCGWRALHYLPIIKAHPCHFSQHPTTEQIGFMWAAAPCNAFWHSADGVP